MAVVASSRERGRGAESVNTTNVIAMKTVLRESICGTGGRAGSRNCGRNATKNNVSSGFRTLTAVAVQTILHALGRSRR